jgi:DNA-binding MarR family transcriptional regulator
MAVQLRPAQALHLWEAVLLEMVRTAEPDLSARQMTILLTLYLETHAHTVRGLAERLGVTKPVITRALDSMGRMGLVTRKRDPADRRNVLIQRTVKGALFVERLGDRVVKKAAELPH